MTCAKLLAVACVAWTAQAFVLGVRQELDGPLGIAFPTPLNPPRIGPLPSISVVFTTSTPTATPTGTLSPPGSGVTSEPFPDDDPSDSETGPAAPTGAPPDMPTIPGGSPAPTSLIVPETDPLFPDNDDPLGSTSPSNRKLVITLSSVLSVVGLLLLLGALLLCRRRRRGSRKPLFSRTISPIDDDEIATWKVPHMSRAEKAAALDDADSPPPTAAAPTTPTRNPNPTTSPHTTHTKDQPSTSSLAPLRKPPSAVIVYSNPHGHHRRCSSDDSYYNLSSASPPGSGGTRKMSFDKVLPQTPIQARAPNAIPGLTDESVPGAMPFVEVVPHHHHQRRLSKVRSSHHVRARSSRSFAAAGGDVWEGGRHSHDYLPRGYHGGVGGHWRVGSASEGQQQHMQQRARGVSFDDDGRGGGGGGWRGGYGEGEIGRAIG